MKLKKNLTMATLLAMAGTPLLGITNNAHASQTYPNNIKYERQVNGKYVATYNNGKGPTAAYGSSSKNTPALLNKSQADAWNSGHQYESSNQADNTQSTARIGSTTGQNTNSNPSWWNLDETARLTRPVTANDVYQDPKGDVYNRTVGQTIFPAGDVVHIYRQGTNGITLNISDANHPAGQNDIEYSVGTSAISALQPINQSSQNTSNNQDNQNSQQSARKSLPQTGESTSNLSLMMASILSLSGIGLAALSLLNKRNQQKGLVHSIIPSITGANGSNDTNIMSETNSLFKEILMDHLK